MLHKLSIVAGVALMAMASLPTAAAVTHPVFDHTATDYNIDHVFYCDDTLGFWHAFSSITVKDPDVAFIQTGDLVDITFTLERPLVAHPTATILQMAVVLDPADKEAFGGEAFDAGLLTITGANVLSPLATFGGAGEAAPDEPTITAAVVGALDVFFVDPDIDGVIGSVHASYTVPGGLPLAGDLAGTVEATLYISNEIFLSTEDCSGIEDPGPLLQKLPHTPFDDLVEVAASLPTETGSRQLDRAAELLGEALEPGLWDGQALTAAGKASVFTTLSQTVAMLSRVTGLGAEDQAAVDAAITGITDAARDLAVNAKDPADAAGGDPGLLFKANKALARGDTQVDLGRHAKAIQLYGTACSQATASMP